MTGVCEITTVHQIRLDNAAFEGNNNVYLLADGDGPTSLIDTGIAMDPVADELRARLADYGVEFADIDRIYLTHFHYDHAGLAGIIQDASGATVYAHRDDTPMVGGGTGPDSAYREAFTDAIDRWDLPSEKREELLANLESKRHLAGDSVDVTSLECERTYAAGSTELRPVHLPGHTLGHVGYLHSNGDLVAGDALLPVYTPNIGGADPRVARPLETYMSTLRKIVHLDPPTAWPGHRDRIDDPIARAQEIRDHHRDRTGRVVDTLAEHGEMGVWEMAITLFGSLSDIHILHGPGEAFAHIDHLVREGVVAESNGRYTLVDDPVDHDEVVPTIS